MPTDRERLQISETATVVEGEAKSSGNVLVHLMRPCLGKGRGRHIYEADMLQRHADGGHFDDWPMFVDHESPEAKRASKGLPRSLRDLGGRVVETHWDASVAEDKKKGFGPGAVVAEVKPVPWVRELIEHDPQLVNVSLNTYATGVKPRKAADGKTGYVVEGFADKGSADWVTLPGAGGRVVQLLEAAIEDVESDDPENTDTVLEGVSDEALAEHITKHRPRVAEAITPTPAGDGGEEETMDPAEIQEAVAEVFESDAGKTLVTAAIAEAAGPAIEEVLKAALPKALGAAAEEIAEGAREAASGELQRARLTTSAAETIKGAKLPEKFEAASIKRVTEAIATVEDAKDDEGKVTESAEDLVKKLVEAEVKEQRELVGSINPTRVRGAGDGGGTEPGDVTEADHDGAHLRHELQEAGVDWKSAWGTVKDEGKDKDKSAPEKDTEPEAAAA